MLLVELSGFDNHTDEAAFFCTTNAENNFASCGSKQGVIAANTNILTRIERSTTLTHEDGTGADEFTTVAFDTETFGLGIASVAVPYVSYGACDGGI